MWGNVTEAPARQGGLDSTLFCHCPALDLSFLWVSRGQPAMPICLVGVFGCQMRQQDSVWEGAGLRLVPPKPCRLNSLVVRRCWCSLVPSAPTGRARVPGSCPLWSLIGAHRPYCLDPTRAPNLGLGAAQGGATRGRARLLGECAGWATGGRVPGLRQPVRPRSVTMKPCPADSAGARRSRPSHREAMTWRPKLLA